MKLLQFQKKSDSMFSLEKAHWKITLLNLIPQYTVSCWVCGLKSPSLHHDVYFEQCNYGLI